jgi:4-hydroxybenzoyl-CoA reductase subunit alpha
VDEAIAGADHVFDDVFFFEGNTHLPLEQHASVALKDPDGKLVIYSSTQTPHYLHRALAKALGMPAAHIRVIATPNGGGFGGKSDPFNHEVVVAKAAIMLESAGEDLPQSRRGLLLPSRSASSAHAVPHRRDQRRPHHRARLQTLLDGGAYGSYGVASTFYTGALQTVTYDIPRYRFRGCRVFTNKPPCGPKRGHGTPQSRFGQEVQLDKIAEKLALDPADLRLNIVARPGLTANYLRVGTIGLAECIRRVVDRSEWRSKFRKLPLGRGVGIACSSYLSGAGLPINWNDLPHSGVQLKLDRSGGVTVFCGATEIGQGSDDVLVATVAEILGIEPFDVRAVTGDTDLTPVDLGSYSSRVTLMMGNAAIQAAERARAMIAEAVAARLGIEQSRLVFADRRVFDRDNSGVGATFQEAVCMAEARFGTLGTTGSYTPPKSAAHFKGGGVGPSPTYSYTAAVVEVEVDPETGWTTVPRVWIAHDVGCALNPTLVRGQVEGSVYMGLGEALMEEQAFRRLPPRLSNALVHKFPSMLEYKSPTSLDMPEIVTDLIEHPIRRGRSARRKWDRARCSRSCRPSPTRCTTRWACASIRCRLVRAHHAALQAKAAGKLPRSGPAAFPDIDWPEPLLVAPPWEGGGWTRLERAAQALSAQSRCGHRSHRRSSLMMRLPAFEYRAPRTIDEAAAALAERPTETMLLAGGTDLLPNMKRRQQTPSRGRQSPLGGRLRGDSSRRRTHDRRRCHAVEPRARTRGSARTIRDCAGGCANRNAHLRNMGTLGGNLCLDTRCTY